jgi:hypothetical protein
LIFSAQANTMNSSPILEVLPANTPAATEPPFTQPDEQPPPPRDSELTWRIVSALFGWPWRLAIGVLFCMSWWTSILVVGWIYRLVQGRVLYAWWKRSPLRSRGSFASFRATLGPDAPVTRPRWFLRERFTTESFRGELLAPTADGEPPLWPRIALRAIASPLRSLWRNVKIGVQALLCIFLLTGWGCLLMTFSWEFGWLNSFTKGYEQFAVGPLTGVSGLLLFCLTLCYVPMAAVHQAVTGDLWAFFDFRFVWRLIRARLSAYLLLSLLTAGMGALLQILKTVPAFFDDSSDFWTNLSDTQLHEALWQYYLFGCVVLFVTLLVTHLLAAHIYRSAVLKVLRRGRVSREQLHPVLAAWLGRLELLPAVQPPPQGLAHVLRATGRAGYRRVLFVLLFLTWLGYGFSVYVAEFLNYHPYVGFLNHPLVQIPCFNYIPPELTAASKQP